MRGLTQRMMHVLNAIEQHIADNNGASPSYRDLAQRLGSKSVSSVYKTCEALVSRGYLKKANRVKGTTRSGSNSLRLVFRESGDPDWESVAMSLIDECKMMRGILADHNLPMPPKSVRY